MAQPHDGDAGQATHGGGHDQGVSDYTHMAGNVTPPEDHQPPIAPDQLFAEIGGDHHGAAGADHGMQPQHDEGTAAHMQPIDMPAETDHGHMAS